MDEAQCRHASSRPTWRDSIRERDASQAIRIYASCGRLLLDHAKKIFSFSKPVNAVSVRNTPSCRRSVLGDFLGAVKGISDAHDRAGLLRRYEKKGKHLRIANISAEHSSSSKRQDNFLYTIKSLFLQLTQYMHGIRCGRSKQN